MKRTRVNRQSGQILVIAILVLGVLLAVGFLFSGIVSRNITQTGVALKRTQGGDLADAGIRYAHTQMQSGALGADWRPAFTLPVFDVATGITRDPDAYYLRPASNFGLRTDADQVIDRGGPDGLGPFTRINFEKGRALIRVRYAPSDPAQFAASSSLLQPGRVRNYTRIESIGRPGRFDANDPTRNTPEGFKVTSYVNSAEFRQELSSLKTLSTRTADTKKLIAYASVGIIENSRFITNKFQQSRPAEIGSLTISATDANSAGLGANYEGTNVSIPLVLGGVQDIGTGVSPEGSGSFVSNADVVLHGNITTTLNKELGDGFLVAGSIKAANNQSSLTVREVNGAVVTPTTLSGNFITSTSNQFGTLNGLIRDGFAKDDANGYTRRVGRKEPPSFLANDPATGLNKYLVMTRDSGPTVNGRNTGRFGQGQGIYIDSREKGNLASETDREASGAAKSLVNDWLNPNNTDSVAWKGPYYIPLATYIQLLPDGFIITRDSNSASRFWRRANGSQTTSSRIRFKLRQVTLPSGEVQVYSLNTVANSVAIALPDASLSDAEFINNGQIFNGVIFSEGDIRLRGIIPTDRQLTIASMGTVYIEGSITKGVVSASGTLINRPSRSMLMLMSKDYICVNTTMFFGPSLGETVSSKRVDPLPNTPNPIELDLSAQRSLNLETEFLLNPINPTTGRPNTDPTSWEPYASTYRAADGSRYTLSNGRGAFPALLLSHSADDNGPSFIDLRIEALTFADITTIAPEAYRFNRTTLFNTGLAALFATPGNIPMYGLTNPSIDAYPRFETITQCIAGPDTAGWSYSALTRRLSPSITEDRGNFFVGMQDPTKFTINLTSIAAFTSKNYSVSRVAVNPHDVRIEAALFAEDGSFFVIPGPAFNMNPDDTRAVFDANVTSLGGLIPAQEQRYQEQGTMPGTPFFGEPLNVRVTVIGALSENMPAPISQQAEWQKKWGWMPRTLPGTDFYAPLQHVPAGYNIVGAAPTDRVLPNIVVTYDSALAQNSVDGINPIRRTPDGRWTLPPMPRLPVSPQLAYFGEEQP